MYIFEKLVSKGAMNLWVAFFAMLGAVFISNGQYLMGFIQIFFLAPLYAHALTSTLIEDYWSGLYKKVISK